MDVGVFVPVSEVFPETAATVTELKVELSRVSRTDGLIWCARLNLFVSAATIGESALKQAAVLGVIFDSHQIERIRNFAAGRTRPDSVHAFFREQLIELMEWIAFECHDHPNDGVTFESSEVRTAFAKAALIVAELWGNRVFSELRDDSNLESVRERNLGAFRNATHSTPVSSDPLHAIGRGYALFVEHYGSIAPEAASVFEAATGLDFNTYFGLAAVIATCCMPRCDDGVLKPQVSGLFSIDQLRKWPRVADAFERYSQTGTQSPSELAAATSIGKSQNRGRFKSCLCRSPILRVDDGRCIVLDPIFFADSLSAGPLFAIANFVSKSDADKYFALFGTAFEKYACSILRRMYPAPEPPLVDRLTCSPLGVDRVGNQVEIADATLTDVHGLALFEMKSAWIGGAILQAGDLPYLDAIRERYVGKGKTVKGVRQLARTCVRLILGEWRTNVLCLSQTQPLWPILLCHDANVASGLHPWFLAREFSKALYSFIREANAPPVLESRVRSLVVISIDDLENLEVSIEHFALFELLREYHQCHPERLCSVHDFIARSKYAPKMFHNREKAERALLALSVARELTSE